jgi:hypothetical protein
MTATYRDFDERPVFEHADLDDEKSTSSDTKAFVLKCAGGDAIFRGPSAAAVHTESAAHAPYCRRATTPVNTVWIVTYDHYLHGVFATQADADAYTERRWGAHPPQRWTVEEHSVGKGAFDPLDEQTSVR